MLTALAVGARGGEERAAPAVGEGVAGTAGPAAAGSPAGAAPPATAGGATGSAVEPGGEADGAPAPPSERPEPASAGAAEAPSGRPEATPPRRPDGAADGRSEPPPVREPSGAAADAPAPSPADAPTPAGPAGDPDPEVAEILERAERAYASLRSLRARFRQTIEVPLLERRREGHGLWYQKGRGRFKMDFREPPEDVIVADGRDLWLYYPSTNPKQVIRSELGSEHPSAATADVLARILSEARTSYTGEYVGREEVSGTSTHLVVLRPVGRSPYRRVRVWIGQQDHLVRRFEIVEENETVRTVTLEALEPNAAIPDSVFRFEPPPDADVFAR